MNFYVYYFGCRTNQAEIQEWITDLENSGYRRTNSLKDADFAILNTCSVTEKAEKDVIKYIEKIYKNTNIKWFIAGCTSTKEENILSKRYKNYSFLNNTKKKTLADIVKEEFPVNDNIIFHSHFRSRIFMKIQDGCNFNCTFCIVPSLRGKSFSFTIPYLTEKAKYYASLGYKEIILAGINLSSYGYDLFPRKNILDLIKELGKITGIELIRLSSIDPRFIRFDFVKELSQTKKIALSFHFSFQSGSNSVLKRMKRSSKVEEYKKIMADFKNFFPNANYGSDFIIGFPGETEREYHDTLEFIKKCGLNYLHAFPFSPRAGTKAAEMKRINSKTMKKRVEEFKELNKELRLRYKEMFRKKITEGIVISEDKENSLVVTSNYLMVKVPILKGYQKRIINVKITKIVNENLCEGRIVKN